MKTASTRWVKKLLGASDAIGAEGCDGAKVITGPKRKPTRRSKKVTCPDVLGGKAEGDAQFCADFIAQGAAHTAGDRGPVEVKTIGGKKFEFQDGMPYIHPRLYGGEGGLFITIEQAKKKKVLQQKVLDEIAKIQKKEQKAAQPPSKLKQFFMDLITEPPKRPKAAAVRRAWGKPKPAPRRRGRKPTPTSASTRRAASDAVEERAWDLGQQYGSTNELSSVKDTEQMYQDALQLGCPPRFFDVFKYGAQDAWRKSGQLPAKKASTAMTTKREHSANTRRSSAVEETPMQTRPVPRTASIRVATPMLREIARSGQFVYQGWLYEVTADAEKTQGKEPHRPDDADAAPFIEDTYDSRKSENPPAMDDLDFAKGKKPSTKAPGADAAAPFVEDTPAEYAGEKPKPVKARFMRRRGLNAIR